MITSVMFLQPRTGQPSWPDPGQTPTPTPVESDSGAATPPAPVGVDNAVVVNTVVSGVSQDSCEKASKSALIVSGGYDFASVLLGVVLFVLMKKKLWGTIFSRYMVGVFVASLGAALLVYFDWGRAEDLTMCLQSADLARYIWPSGSNVARALVQGARVLDLRVVDHVIIGREGTFSFRDAGLLRRMSEEA